MKQSLRFVLVGLTSFLLLDLAAEAAGRGNSQIAGGARLHRNRDNIEGYLYGDGDVSYQLAYEYHADTTYFQLGVGYCPDISGTNEVDYIITPQLNFFVTDRGWEAGVGIADSYITDDNEATDDWSDLYYQMMLGYQFPIMKIPISFDAVYPFESWGDLSDFDFKDIEYMVMVHFKF
jgi:hypothetical protein